MCKASLVFPSKLILAECEDEEHAYNGLQEVIVTAPPSVILLELAPPQMDIVGLADAATLLRQLYDLGYTEISHSG